MTRRVSQASRYPVLPCPCPPPPPLPLPGFFGRILCHWGSASPTCGTSERAFPARCHGEESVFPTGEEHLNVHREHHHAPTSPHLFPYPARRQPLPGRGKPSSAAAGPARHSPARRRAPWRGCGSCPSAGSPGPGDRPRSGGDSRRRPARRAAATAAPGPYLRRGRCVGARNAGVCPRLAPHLLAPPPGRGPRPWRCGARHGAAAIGRRCPRISYICRDLTVMTGVSLTCAARGHREPARPERGHGSAGGREHLSHRQDPLSSATQRSRQKWVSRARW